MAKEQLSKRGFLWTYRKEFTVVMVFSFFANLSMLAMPLYMLQIFERVITTGSRDTLLYLTLITVAVLLVMGYMLSLRSNIMTAIGEKIDLSLSPIVLKRQFEEAVNSDRTQDTQPLRDLNSVRSFLASAAVNAFFDAPWTPLYIAVIFAFHPLMGWTAIAGAVVLMGVAVATELLTRDVMKKANDEQTAAYGVVQTYLKDSDTVSSMGLAQAAIRRWNDFHLKASDKHVRAAEIAGSLSNAGKSLRIILQVVILGVGAYLVLKQEIHPGMMFVGSILLGRAMGPIEMLLGGWRNVVRAMQANQRLQAFLSDRPERPQNIELPRPKGLVSVDKLYYTPKGSDQAIIKGLQFSIQPGEMIAITGPSGAGKTTLGRMLVGALRPSVGRIRLDNADILEYQDEDRFRYLGYLSQDVTLFPGTIAQNIARMSDPDEEKVREAAELANVDGLIRRLPGGYGAEIKVGRSQLSGGQRQRIGIARALYGGPAFLVLDEPNSNLDSEGEAALMDTLTKLKERGMTIAVITHRGPILSIVDRLLVMRDGTISAYGPRDEIIRQLNAAAQSQQGGGKPSKPGAAAGAGAASKAAAGTPAAAGAAPPGAGLAGAGQAGAGQAGAAKPSPTGGASARRRVNAPQQVNNDEGEES